MNSQDQTLNDARLVALQNQIVPHYIVNTLDAVRMKLLIDGQDSSAELLRRLQDSLRTYAFDPHDTVTLAGELEFLEDHLHLQRFRLLGKLTWDFSVPAELLDARIPRFLLQPLAENSVRHGLVAAASPHLHISAAMSGEHLTICVSDNGAGIPAEPASGGIGLANIRERLRLLFGDAADLTLKSIPGSGTAAVIRLPKGCVEP